MIRRAILGLALLLAAMGGDSLGQSQEPPPSSREPGKPPQAKPQNNQYPAATDNRDTEKSPLIIRRIKSNEEAAQDTRDREDKASTDWWMTIFSGAVAIGAFLQAAALFVIIRTTRSQLRAYVFVTQVRIMTLPGRKEPSIVVLFKNTGQTPAYELTISADKKVTEYPLKSDLTSVYPSNRIGSVGAGTNSRIVINEFSLTGNERQEMRKDKLAVYVFGLIEYKDAFSQWRWTTYRFFGGGGAPIGPDGELALHASGNDAK